MSGCGKEKKTTAPNKFQSDYMEVWGGTTVEEGDFRVINVNVKSYALAN